MLTRRGLLRLAALLGLSATAMGSLAVRPESTGGDALVRQIFRSRRSAARLGSEYLRMRPSEADRRALRNLLGLPPEPEALLSQHGLETQAARVFALHREDFRRGRVSRVAGWTLSLTELRLCALVALEEDDRDPVL